MDVSFPALSIYSWLRRWASESYRLTYRSFGMKKWWTKNLQRNDTRKLAKKAKRRLVVSCKRAVQMKRGEPGRSTKRSAGGEEIPVNSWTDWSWREAASRLYRVLISLSLSGPWQRTLWLLEAYSQVRKRDYRRLARLSNTEGCCAIGSVFWSRLLQQQQTQLINLSETFQSMRIVYRSWTSNILFGNLLRQLYEEPVVRYGK